MSEQSGHSTGDVSGESTDPGLDNDEDARASVERDSAQTPRRDRPDPTAHFEWPLNEPLMEDWLITVTAEYPKRLGGWKVLYCCPPRIWRALVV